MLKSNIYRNEENMNEIQILKSGLKSMHNLLDKALGDMTPQQWNYWPHEGGVSAFFSLWHYVRTEDNIINYVIKKENTIWLTNEYNISFNLHRTSQGTGMTYEQAKEVSISNIALWSEYQQQVWKSTEDLLANIDINELHEREIIVKPIPPMTVWRGLFNLCLTHGFRHVGEIEHARGLVGLGGLVI